WCSRLKEEGGAVVLEALRGLDLQGKGRAARSSRAEGVGYYANQVHRMDYPRYVARGWQIGSGAVESAGRTAAGARRKGGGMRWGEDGADAVAHLRALFRSEAGPWAAFWSLN